MLRDVRPPARRCERITKMLQESVSLGGVLGAGQRYVALNPNSVKVSFNDSDKKWHATTNATADQLKAAPEFKYSGRWNASKS
jgi:hypothetical protein